MILNNIIQKIEEKYPLNLAYNWDNVGLLVGDKNSNIEKIVVALEANEKVIDEAINEGVNLIITHHPFLFSKLNKIVKDDFKGNLVHKLIKNDISIYSMHTNFDIAKDGLNDYFLELMNLSSEEVLEQTFENDGLGRIVNIDKNLKELSLEIKKNLNISDLRVVGNLENTCKKVAIVTGSGSSLMSLCVEKNIDTLITGDVKYHEAQDALDMNLNVIDCGHFGSEDIFKSVMKRFLDNTFNVSVIESRVNLNPFKIL